MTFLAMATTGYSADMVAWQYAQLTVVTVRWQQDNESQDAAGSGGSAGAGDVGVLAGRLLIECTVVRPRSQSDIARIESFRADYRRPGIGEEQRRQVKAALADYAASWVQGHWDGPQYEAPRSLWRFEDADWDVKRWMTPQSLPLPQAAALFEGSAEWLHGLVERPLADMASAAGIANPIGPMGAGILANFVAGPATEPLEDAARLFEIAGLVIGLATGAYPLALACGKQLVHDVVSDALAEGFEHIMDAINSGIERINQPAMTRKEFNDEVNAHPGYDGRPPGWKDPEESIRHLKQDPRPDGPLSGPGILPRH
jgi:hypothetical protein